MNRQRFLTAAAVILVIVVLLSGFFFMGSRIGRLSEQLAARDETDRTEREQVSHTMDLLKQNILLLRQDNARFREHFQLPPREYPPFEEQVSSGEADENPVRIFFSAVEAVADRNRLDALLSEFGDFLDSREFKSLLETRGLTVRRSGDGLSAVLSDSRGEAFTVTALEAGRREIRSLLGDSAEFAEPAGMTAFLNAAQPALEAWGVRVKEASQVIAGLSSRQDISGPAAEKGLKWVALRETSGKLSRVLADAAGKAAVSVEFDKITETWNCAGETAGDPAALRELILRGIRNYDPRDPGDIAAEESLREILALRDDSGFTAYLNTLNLVMSDSPREDHYYQYVDLKDSEGNLQGSLAVQKHSGEIYLMDRDDVVITSLKTLGLNQGIPVKKNAVLPDDWSAAEPLVLNDRDITFLLIGANESNTDTMMVVHLNSDTGKGTIITVPRDLYYKGRKINSIYPSYGPGELMATLSEITGLPVKRYVYIDMFAFADVVDLLGGVDIVLKEPLIDPTYRIKENGKWSTLHYSAGPLHLGGVEALRVARSRHSSSDFGRAERQQQLLLALRDRMLELNAGDAGKVVDLVQILLSYVRTDFSALEILNLYSRYRNASFTQRVLSWDNVLYNTYSNTYMLDPDTEIADDFDKGAWILLPLNNDWSVIRWYIGQAIKEE